MTFLLKLKHIFVISDISCRSKLAKLNEKITSLELKIEYIEARVRICDHFCLVICLFVGVIKGWSGGWVLELYMPILPD